jgi:hypothetical protein
MKKNLFNNFTRLFAFVSLFSLPFSSVKAQNAADYGFQAVSGTYVPLSSGTELFEVEDDDMSSNNMVDLGFTFNFCGTDYTQVKPNSNGWISFADVFPFPWEMRENEDFNLPLMTPMLQPLWDDHSGYSFNTGYFAYTTTGTSPNQVFTAEWRNWMWIFYLSTPTISFQVKLYEGTNVIEYVYRQESGFLDGFAEAATIGIANNPGDFQTLPDASTNPTPSSLTFYNGINSKPATGQIYRWTPPPPCGGAPVPGAAVASVTSVNCEGDVDLSLSGNGIATQLEYQWEYSTDGGGSWLPIGGPQSSEYTSFTVTQTSQIHAVVTCLSSGLSATSTPVTVTSNPPVAGASQAAPSLVCNGGSTDLSTAGSTSNGVSYQWQSSPNNVIFTNISGATNPIYTTPALVAPIYYRAVLTCDVNTGTNNASSVFVDLLTNTAPGASPALSTIICGDSIVLTGNATGNAPTVVWYDQATGGSPVSIGENVTLFPVTNTTYYAENSNVPPVTQVTANNFAIVDHEPQTGDDRGGIALSSQYLYVTGDNNTVRLNKFSLGNALQLPRRDGIFSTVASQTVYCFGDASGVDIDYAWTGGTIDRIYAMDASLNTVGAPIIMSQSFNIPAFSNPYFIAPGDGYVLFMETDFTDYTWYRIDLTTGNVTTISTVPLDMVDAEAFASWGWAEFDGGSYHVVYNKNNNFEIGKMNLTTGLSTVIGTFSYLSDMASIAFDPGTLRMYFHYEGSSNDFGGSDETAGYTGLEVNSGCANNTRTPVQVNVIPPVPTITPSGTFNICTGGNAALAASTGASYQWYLAGNPVAGATSQNYTATTPGNYTVEVTTADGCPGMSLVTNVAVQTPQPVSALITVGPNDTVCNGTPTTFTATPTNGGNNTSYQWKKNNVNVGTNSAIYTTPALVNGDQIKVVMTVGPGVCPVSPTATSNTITMVVNPNVAPTITINANPGISACEDDIIDFSTTPTNSGTAPSYQWKVNGTNVGTNSPLYSALPGALNTGDVVSVTMTSNQACALPTSVTQSVVMTVDPLTTPVIDIVADQTNVCQGTVVTFTATDNAPGGLYQWKVNGNPSGPNNAVYAYTPAVGDVISLDFTPPAAGCYENITVTSNDIPVFVTPGLPTMATVSASPSGAVQGQTVVLNANLFNFSTNYTIEWYINAALYTTTTVPFTDYVKGSGVDDIYIVVSGTGQGCYDVATSPNISVAEWAASVGETVSKTNIEIFPNPFNNSITVKGLAQGDEIRLMNMLGQTIQVWNPEKVTPEQVLKLTDLAAGSYIISIRNKDGITQKIEKLQKI